jgi:hypothetical protein
MARDQGNQGGRGGNLSDEDRSKGGKTSANEQKRDDQGQFAGMGGRSGSGNRGGNKGGGSSSGGNRGGSQGGGNR